MNEHLVSLATALKLKEKGFPQGEKDDALFYMDGQLMNRLEANLYEDSHEAETVCEAVALNDANDWLRREKHVYVTVTPTWESKITLPDSFIAEYDYRNGNGRFVSHEVCYEGDHIYHDFPTYEMALEAAIYEALDKA